MRSLTKKHGLEVVEESEFLQFETDFNVRLGIELKNFIRHYHGSKVNEILFFDQEQGMWIVNGFFSFKETIELTAEFLKSYNKPLLPFAYDPGGWHFCLSLEDKDHNTVYVNRWTDHLPEDQFLKIANSFEDFINQLQPEN